MRPIPLLCVGLLSASCSSGPAGSFEAATATVCPACAVSCPTGFAPVDGGLGCAPVLPDSACPAGTRPQLGSTTCVPVGVTSCGPGFQVDPSGWGCHEVLSEAPCSGESREALGSSTCTPVGDCAGAWPPPGATLFVKASYLPGELDGTHFLSVNEAVAVADAGAVIAIDQGVYRERVFPSVPLSFWGRCPQQVVFDTGDGGTSGFILRDLSGTVVRNVTVRGFQGGVVVYGGSAELTNVVVEGNRVAGIAISNPGTQVTLKSSVVRNTVASTGASQSMGVTVQKQASLVGDDVVLAGNEFTNLAASGTGTSVRLSRAVVRDGVPMRQGPAVGTMGTGLYISNGSTLDLDLSVVRDNVANGVIFSQGGQAPGSGQVRRSVVRGTRLNPTMANIGRGVEAAKGATMLVEETTVVGNAEHEVLVTEGSVGTLRNVTTLGGPTATTPGGTGLLVSDLAHAQADSVALVMSHQAGLAMQAQGVATVQRSLVLTPVVAPNPTATWGKSGYGVTLREGTTLTLADSAVLGPTGAAVLVSGSSATLTDVVVTDPQPIQGEGGRSFTIQDGSTMDATRVALLRSREVAVVGFDPGTLVLLKDSTIDGCQTDAFGLFGMGLLVTDDAMAVVERSTLLRAALVGVAAAGGGAVLKSSFVSDNTVGAVVQDGTELRAGGTPSLTARVLGISEDTRFLANGTRIGTAAVPLPKR